MAEGNLIPRSLELIEDDGVPHIVQSMNIRAIEVLEDSAGDVRGVRVAGEAESDGKYLTIVMSLMDETQDDAAACLDVSMTDWGAGPMDKGTAGSILKKMMKPVKNPADVVRVLDGLGIK